jgi:acetylornithine deacetylase
VTAGREAVLEGATFGADMRHFVNVDRIPTVLFGPGNVRQAHFADEYVILEEVALATSVLALAVYEW